MYVASVCEECGSIVVGCLGDFFFLKQKTAYELRISDWSSDVCSSDLKIGIARDEAASLHVRETEQADIRAVEARHQRVLQYAVRRSEERRVGKECVSTCRSRWSPTH